VNLLDNAIGATRKVEQPRIRVGWKKGGQEFMFYVRDNGIGIRKRDLPKVFEPSSLWARRNGERGWGVGLIIAKKIIDAHGGKIWAESAYGRGTTVYFTLPKRHARTGRECFA